MKGNSVLIQVEVFLCHLTECEQILQEIACPKYVGNVFCV